MSSTVDGQLLAADRKSLASTVRDAVAGDEAAFAELVAMYHRDMVRVCYVVTGDVDAAHEAAQSAWAVAWVKLGMVRDPVHVRGWLMAVAGNEARQLARRTRRQAVREIAVDGDPAMFELASVEGPDHSASLDLAAVLQRHSPDDRTLIAMRYVLGLTSAEIGTALGMPPGTVRVRLSRLLARLREELHHE